MKTWLAILVLCGLLMSCSSPTEAPPTRLEHSPTTTTPPDAGSYTTVLAEQPYLFERQYLNFAWGYEHHGVFVDNQGRVYEFDCKDAGNQPWEPRHGERWPAQMLEQRYAGARELPVTIPTEKLAELYALIEPASCGTLSEPGVGAMDAGLDWSSCYRFDPERQTYVSVILRIGGDYERRNASDAASQIADYLDTIWPYR